MRNQKDFYEERHRKEDQYSGGQHPIARLLATHALRAWGDDHRDGHLAVLDVGCGQGLFLRDFLQHALSQWGMKPKRIAGIDLVKSPHHIFDQYPVPMEFIQQNLDGETLPYANEAFTFVCCNHVLEHVFETEKLLREIGRVMHRDGLAVISVPNIACWINRVLFLFGSQPLGSEVGTESATYGFWPTAGQARLKRFIPSGHVRDFTPRALRDLATACGFDTVGWWNQDPHLCFRLTAWAGRGIGIILKKKRP